ncbi:MAG: hypothetical protein AB1941_25290 [Gemmatimonadota bacterium]
MTDVPGRPPRRDPAEPATELTVPFTGAGEDPDRVRARMERAAALLRPDAGEPVATIHTDHWREARESARRGRTRLARLVTRLLEHHERGWEFVRPLALAAEEAGGWARGADAASAMYRFTKVEIVDLYRYNAFRCAEMVAARRVGDRPPSMDDVDAETDAFYRCVQLLRLASAHPLAPPEFRVLAEHSAGLDGWYAEFGGVFAPAAEAFHRRLGGRGG